MGPQDYIYAADTTNIQAGGKSMLDEVGDAIKIGGTSAVISGLSSIYNTGVDVANFFGAEADRIDVQQKISNIDQNWGDYYAAHKDVIDTVGFIGTSFIPGGLAVKGLNALRRGESIGAFGRALGFTARKQTEALDAALQVIASPEGSIFTRFNKNFVASLGWGVADNALQAATFELAVAATMKASPLLDKSSWSDLSYDMVKTSFFGGLAGGAIEGLFMNRILKDATKLIDRGSAKYQTLTSAFDKTALEEADKTYGLIDSVLKLPKEVFEDDKVLNFSYHLNGQSRSVPLDVSALRTNELQKATKNAYLDIEKRLTNYLGDDPSVGTGFANALVKIVKDGKVAGKSEDEIRSRVGDYLFNLERIEPATISSVKSEDLYYFNKSATFQEGPLTKDKLYAGKGTGYQLIGNEPPKIALVGRDVQLTKDAWKAGYDIAFKPNGTWSINPGSAIVKQVREPSGIRRFFNTTSGETSDTAVLTAADIATSRAPLQVLGSTVRAGDRQFTFTVGNLPATGDAVEQTARHLWASKLEKINGVVSADDVSILDRMSSAKHVVADDTRVAIPGISEPVPWRDLGNFDDFVFSNKVDKLKRIAEKGEFDVRQVAYELNTSPQWVEDVIASKFQTDLKKLADGAPDLRSGWQRELASYSNRDTVILNYKKTQAMQMDDFGNAVPLPRREIPLTTDQGHTIMVDAEAHNKFITGQQAYAYRVSLAQQQLDNAVASVFGTDAARFGAWTFEELSGLADRTGTGASLTGFSNANYGDKLALFSQELGKQTHLLGQEVVNGILTRAQPHLASLKNSPKDVGELVAIVTKLRRSPESFTLLGAEYGLDGTYLVDRRLIARGTSPEVVAEIRGIAQTSTQGDIQAFKIESEMVSNFLREHMAINDDLLSKRKVLLNAQGLTSNIPEGTVRIPPIDTRKVPYFAFVRSVDGRIFGDSNVSMITAKTSEELQRLAAQIDSKQLEVIFKKDSERFFKAKGDYEYSRGINESAINSQLKREGKLGDYLPSFQPEDVLEDFVQYYQRQGTQLVRDGVSTKYSQTFTELRRLSDQYTTAATSKAEPVGKLFQRKVADPYDDYIKGALDISKRSEFTILHQMNEFIDALGTRAYQAADTATRDALKGKITWEEANNQLERYGLGAPYTSEHAYKVAQTVADRNLIKTGLQKANMILANVTLRFDAANSLMNIISTPIMLGTELSSIRRSIQKDPELVGKLAELTSVALPDGSGSVPSMTKLVYNGVKNFWGAEKDELLKRYTKNGDVKGVLSQYHEMIGDMSILPSVVPSKFNANVDKWTEKVASGFGNNFAEQFTRFVSADVMRQITDPLVQAGKMGVQEQNAYISVFVNRVQGNYIASQRPILFQGTLGSALGLFQTYQFNLLQQLFRHIEDRNFKTVAVMGGLQTSLFGLNGLPLFEAINTKLIGEANINAGHRDIYSTISQTNKAFGDWLLYGTASAFPLFGGKGPALYTRGDINPRHATVVPMMPQDVPAVDGTVRFVKNLMNVASKIGAGGSVSASLMEGLEHNSISRPLAGLAQAIQGYSTTSKGSLIAANNDFFSIANASRILGAKPLDEAVLLNSKFRVEAYKAADREAIVTLGEAVKTKLRRRESPSDEDFQSFMGQYAAHGGRVENFSRAIQAWSKDANQSILNKLSEQVRSPYGQRMIEIMGGSRVEEFDIPPN